jgi:hypothetical protein
MELAGVENLLNVFDKICRRIEIDVCNDFVTLYWRIPRCVYIFIYI